MGSRNNSPVLFQPAFDQNPHRLVALRTALLDSRHHHHFEDQLGRDARGDAPEQVGRDRDQHRGREHEELLAADVRNVLPHLGRAQLVAGIENDRPQNGHGHQVDQAPSQEQVEIRKQAL